MATWGRGSFKAQLLGGTFLTTLQGLSLEQESSIPEEAACPPPHTHSPSMVYTESGWSKAHLCQNPPSSGPPLSHVDAGGCQCPG